MWVACDFEYKHASRYACERGSGELSENFEPPESLVGRPVLWVGADLRGCLAYRSAANQML